MALGTKHEWNSSNCSNESCCETWFTDYTIARRFTPGSSRQNRKCTRACNDYYLSYYTLAYWYLRHRFKCERWHHACALRSLRSFIYEIIVIYSRSFDPVRRYCGEWICKYEPVYCSASLLFASVNLQLLGARAVDCNIAWRHAKMLKNVDWYVDLLFDNCGNYTCKQLMFYISLRTLSDE